MSEKFLTQKEAREIFINELKTNPCKNMFVQDAEALLIAAFDKATVLPIRPIFTVREISNSRLMGYTNTNIIKKTITNPNNKHIFNPLDLSNKNPERYKELLKKKGLSEDEIEIELKKLSPKKLKRYAAFQDDINDYIDVHKTN